MPVLTSTPIDVSSLIAAVQSPARGGIASFVGVVRDHHGGRAVVRLSYTAYPAMVEAECARIVGEAERRWPVAVAVRHRVGSLEIGEVAIVVAVGAPHREAAFEACRFVVDEVKRRAPIWKQESYADGGIGWVEPAAVEPHIPAESVQ